MCLIIHKPKGINLPSRKIFKNANQNNPDGIGIMISTGKNVHIIKGFFSVKKLFKRLYSLNNFYGNLKDYEMVFHFRLATHGKVKPDNCHPFPLSSNINDLQKIEIKCQAGIAHNGILSFIEADKILSDTQIFIRDFIGHFTFADFKNERIYKLIEKLIEGDKIIILNYDGETIKFGNWIEEKGLFFSNYTFQYEKTFFYESDQFTSDGFSWCDYEERCEGCNRWEDTKRLTTTPYGRLCEMCIYELGLSFERLSKQ